jgi:dipeptidyl aminopeptidase/acylaminoacyl peptidase
MFELMMLLALRQTSLPSPTEAYLRPPRVIEQGALAPYYLNVTSVSVSPDGARYLISVRDGAPPLAWLAKAHVNLGGFQVDTLANRERSLTTRNLAGIRIFDIHTGTTVTADAPPDSRVSDPQWSPDSKKLAFFVLQNDRTMLYVADAATGKGRAITSRAVLATLDPTFEWSRDGQSLAVVLVPKNRAPLPTEPAVATTPRVQTTDLKTSKLETFPSVLGTPYDQALVDYYATGELASIEVSTGRVRSVGQPARFERVSPSPHAKYFLVTLLEKPYSYLVPVSNFGEKQVILDENGKELAQFDDRLLREGAPDEEKGRNDVKRSPQWRGDTDELLFLQNLAPASDDGETAARRTDHVQLWKPPFASKNVSSLYEAAGTISDYVQASDGHGLFITTGAPMGRRAAAAADGAEPTRRISYLSAPDAKLMQIAEIRPNGDETAALVTMNGEARESADRKFAYLSGEHTFKDPYTQAPKPYIDRVDLSTGKKERIFESKDDQFEQPTMLEGEGKELLVTRQSPTSVPQIFLHAGGSSADRQLTANKDYLPDVSQARREYITVTRADGFKLKVLVTLPAYAFHNPAFFWIYPSEFASQEEYDRSKRNFNKNLFSSPTGANKEILTRLGYVVVQPDIPIVGPRGRMNDEYVPELRNTLSAVIDEVERRDWIDRRYLGVGGHSYGAFSTANTLAHTPFFKCGIAGDGNYLRPLTPFGFQNEQRQLWEARGTYLDMSPLLYVEQFTGALLMYHGMEDQNVGTNPINSQRLFTALQELGKPAELIMYPYEDHGQIAKETVLDQWARFSAWLDRWLKPDGKEANSK